MMMQTQDIWQSAFMLAKGISLEDVKVDPKIGGRKDVTFVLGGENVGQLFHEFRTGQAVCNVAQIRAGMIHLKEEMYRALKS